MSIHTLISPTPRPTPSHPATRRRVAQQRMSPCSAALSSAHLAHRAAVARWALANGRSINLTALTLLIGTKQADASVSKVPFTCWTDRSLDDFLYEHVPIWAMQHSVHVPPSFAETLFVYIDALAHTGGLHPKSSSVTDLHAMVAHLGNLTVDGISVRQTSVRARRRSPVGGPGRRSSKI